MTGTACGRLLTMATSSDRPSEEHVVARRVRDVAAVILAITSGATDAIAFLALGGAFTSVMTGNLVLLGISLGQADAALGRQIAVAVIGYIAGCYIGARITGALAHILNEKNAQFGVATMCIGMGQGVATVLERVA